MNEAEGPQSYDVAVFQILAYEFDFDSPKDAERKIRAKLRRSDLGSYDQQRIDYIRSLKNDLQKEISLFNKSKYFVGPIGATADQEHFSYDKMVSDYLARFPKISEADMRSIVTFSIYLYYLR